MKIESERVIIEAPLSFTGSAKRIWRVSDSVVYQVLAVLIFIPLAWVFILAWYMIFGIFLVPYRMIRRSQRKQKRDALRHKELLGHED